METCPLFPALLSAEPLLHLWNSNFCYKWSACARKQLVFVPTVGVSVCTLTRGLVFRPACWSCLCNHTCVFRPFLLTVESRQLPGGARVCCSVMKAFLISGLGCSVHASRLETAEINTSCPVERSLAVTSLTLYPSEGCCGQLLTPGVLSVSTPERMIPSVWTNEPTCKDLKKMQP